jgi:hypothetical protein
VFVVTLEELFEASRQIELTNARIYAEFSLGLGDVDDRIADFWEEASKEEWEHYIRVNFGQKLCSDVLDMDQEVTEMSADRIASACHELQNYEDRVREGDIELEEAFRIAIDMESGEANFIYQTILEYIREAIEESGKTYLYSRIEDVEEDMDEHVQEFIDAMKRFTQDPSLVQEATESLSSQ